MVWNEWLWLCSRCSLTGLIGGGPQPGIFRPSDPVTIAEAIKLPLSYIIFIRAGAGYLKNNKANESWYIR